jgi:hypothetical protein
VTRLRLKHGEHQVSLPNALGGTLVTVKVDQRYQVISLRVVGNQVFAGGRPPRSRRAHNPTVASLK